VDGTEYHGSRLAYGYQEIHDKLKGAKSIEVRYNPTNPASSTLSYGMHRSIKFMFVFAFTWLAFMFGFTWLLWLAFQSDTVLLRNLSVQ
jgi:hypothetical protein